MKYYGILFAAIFYSANAFDNSNTLEDLKEKKDAVKTAVEWVNGTKKSKQLPQALTCIRKQSEYIEALEKQSYSNENLKNQFQYIEKLENSIRELNHKLGEEKERNELFRSQLVVLIQENDENKNLKEKIEIINKENKNLNDRYSSDIRCL